MAETRAKKRQPPFSIRLTNEQRAQLERSAGELPLAVYVKACLFGSENKVRVRRTYRSVEDKKALAQTLALLGQSRIPHNLNQVARAANMGTLPVTAEVEEDLEEACRLVQEIKMLLVDALGLRTGSQS